MTRRRVLAPCWLLLLTQVAACQTATAPADSKAEALSRFDFREVIAGAKDKVFPAVVYIKCLRQSHESGKKQTQEVTGSGVIIAENGLVLSNWHVVDKATEVRCLLFGGRAYEAEIAGTDKDLDLALLRLKLDANTKPLPFAEIGNSDKLKEGDFVMAMGAPWGLSRSVSIGIISCTRRYLPKNSEYSLWLQTDAAISPGNSGGPLVDTDGKVIGINTRGMTSGGDMGFAVPSKVIGQILPRLKEHGNVKWSWTGLVLQPIRDFNKNVYFKGTEGVIIASVDPDSPAQKAGIENQDRILSINGRPTNGLTEEELPNIRRQIALLPLDEPATVKLLRDGKEMTLKLTPRQKGSVEGKELDCPRWDLAVKTINQFDNPQLYFYRKKGVFIYGTKRPGNAALAGLARNDILLKIGKEKVTSLEDVKRIHKKLVDNVDKKHKVLFTVLRNGLMRQVILDYQRDFERE
ncbi:MAG: trypsin-like peptidase domain-containing protein [Phycisphaeraceae bacterium]|nr:trypsin-like peptidase domain-containing protein [Phycisphaeraceae bacterium]